MERVRLFTNPGSNLSPEAVRRYGYVLAPQQIVVDGVSHDTREHVPLRAVDQWVTTAAEFPHVVGTTAAEMLDLFLASLEHDPELLGITTSRTIIRTYDAARSAARTLSEQPRYAGARIEIVDSCTTDLGAALVCVAAGEAVQAGWSLEETAKLATEMAESGLTVLYIQELDRFVRGGRAGHVRAWLANTLGLRPLIGFLDGELSAIGTVRGTDDPGPLLADAALRRFGEKRPVWIAVTHGGAPDRAARVVAACRRHFDVRFAWVRPLASSIYLHLGRDAVGLFVVPMDGLTQTPPTPAVFDDE